MHAFRDVAGFVACGDDDGDSRWVGWDGVGFVAKEAGVCEANDCRDGGDDPREGREECDHVGVLRYDEGHMLNICENICKSSHQTFMPNAERRTVWCASRHPSLSRGTGCFDLFAVMTGSFDSGCCRSSSSTLMYWYWNFCSGRSIRDR